VDIRYIDMIGKQIGRLTVVALAGRKIYSSGSSVILWKCRCSCGNETTVRSGALRKWNATKSCGCINKEIQRKHFKTHGLSRTTTYKSWHSMRQRCLNPQHEAYSRYGGNSITICAEWQNDFEVFLMDMGSRPVGTTLDRINNDIGYQPDNCRWVGWKQQERNRTNHFMIDYAGEKRCLAEWSELLGIKYPTLWARFKRHGMDPVDAFERPLRRWTKNG
jgi:hypothetical protein